MSSHHYPPVVQNEWLSKMTDEIQSYADQHDSKCFYKPSSSPIEIKSWRNGSNFSALFSTILHQSMMRHFNAFHKFWSIMNSMHHPLLVKLKRSLGSYQMARHPGLMLYLPKSTNMVGL